MKYCLSPREIPRAEPKGFPEGSGNISSYTLICRNEDVRWSEANLCHFFLPNTVLEHSPLWQGFISPPPPGLSASQAICQSSVWNRNPVTGFPAIGWLWCTDSPKGQNGSGSSNTELWSLEVPLKKPLHLHTANLQLTLKSTLLTQMQVYLI